MLYFVNLLCYCTASKILPKLSWGNQAVHCVFHTQRGTQEVVLYPLSSASPRLP